MKHFNIITQSGKTYTDWAGESVDDVLNGPGGFYHEYPQYEGYDYTWEYNDDGDINIIIKD